MEFGGFDLNVPVVSDQGTYIIDLNKNPDDINFSGDEIAVPLEHNDVPVGENQIDLNIIEEYANEDGVALINQFDAAGYNGGMLVNKKKKWLTDEQQDIVYDSLLRISINGKLNKSATNEVESLFNLHIRQVQRIWEKKKGKPLGEVRKKHKCGRKRLQVDINHIPEIPLNQRTTLESLANALGVSHTTLFRRFKEGLFRRHSNAIKPQLHEANKRSRLQFCVSMLDQSTLLNEPKFIGMYNIIHIDEKWFYMTRKDENYYLHPLEEEPLRTVQSKNFIGKIMFLAAMAPPRFDNDGNEVFSGKIGEFYWENHVLLYFRSM